MVNSPSGIALRRPSEDTSELRAKVKVKAAYSNVPEVLHLGINIIPSFGLCQVGENKLHKEDIVYQNDNEQLRCFAHLFDARTTRRLRREY
jgi:hypothetical protein